MQDFFVKKFSGQGAGQFAKKEFMRTNEKGVKPDAQFLKLHAVLAICGIKSMDQLAALSGTSPMTLCNVVSKKKNEKKLCGFAGPYINVWSTLRDAYWDRCKEMTQTDAVIAYAFLDDYRRHILGVLLLEEQDLSDMPKSKGTEMRLEKVHQLIALFSTPIFDLKLPELPWAKRSS
jgi:hypothetical protein